RDLVADRPGGVGPRSQVQPEAGVGVDLDDYASLLLERTGDVHRDDIEPRNGNLHHLGRGDRVADGRWVNHVRQVSQGATVLEIGRIAADQDLFSRGRHRVERVTLRCEHGESDIVEL